MSARIEKSETQKIDQPYSSSVLRKMRVLLEILFFIDINFIVYLITYLIWSTIKKNQKVIIKNKKWENLMCELSYQCR